MYKIDEILGADQVREHALTPPPFGPGFGNGQVKTATRMEIWGTNFNDPGPDFTEFRLFKGSVFLASRRLNGY